MRRRTAEGRSPSNLVSPSNAIDVWTTFRDALSPLEREALALALRGDDAGMRALADANGVMLEVLADGINEKAMDCVGDNILSLDDGVAVYEEYKDKL